MLKENIKLIDKDEGLLSLMPVPGNSIQDAVQDYQDAHTHKLLAKLMNIVTDEPAGGIHIGLLCKGIQGPSRENLQFQCQVFCLLFWLPEKVFSKVIQSRRLTLVPTHPVRLIDMFHAAVDDRLLPPAELVAGYNLLTE